MSMSVAGKFLIAVDYTLDALAAVDARVVGWNLIAVQVHSTLVLAVTSGDARVVMRCGRCEISG